MKTQLFKYLIEPLRIVLSQKVEIKPTERLVSDIEKEIDENISIIKKAFDEDLIDLKEYSEKLQELKKAKEELKVKSQSYADAIIRNVKGEILLLLRNTQDEFYPETWGLPGGKIEKNEKPEDAVGREVSEETNLTVFGHDLVHTKKIDSGKIYYYECVVKEDVELAVIILDNEEHYNYKWMNKKEWGEANLILDLGDTLNELYPLDIQEVKFDLFPPLFFDESSSPYSNIEEAIANQSNDIPPKDTYMITLLAKGEIESEEYADYIYKAYNKNGKVELKGQDQKKTVVKRWVGKKELSQLAKHAKNASHQDLETTIKESKHPQLREHAHKEIQRREKSEIPKDTTEMEHEKHSLHKKEIKWSGKDDSYMDENGGKISQEKLNEYYNQKSSDYQSKYDEAKSLLDKQTKSHNSLKNKLIKQFYHRVGKTPVKEGMEDVAYKTALSKLEKMGLTTKDIDEKKAKGILEKKVKKSSIKKADEESDIEKGSKFNHKYIRKEGDKYIYEDKEGKQYESETMLHKEKKERVPQWYDKLNTEYQPSRLPVGVEEKDVTINTNFEENNWLMKWIDPKTGKQIAAYPKAFLKKNAEQKWKRIQAVSSKQIESIREKATSLLGNKKKEINESAAVVSIIAYTGLRPGSKSGFDSTANRGTSTLAKENVKIDGDKISFEFTGKSYKNNTAEIVNQELATYLSNKLEKLEGKDFIFDTDINAVRDIFKDSISPKKGMKLKDMRTYVATDMARKILFKDKSAPPPLPEKGKQKAIQDKLKHCFEKVSSQLNNSPNMAKTSYIHPKVINEWLSTLNAKETEKFIMKAESDDNDFIEDDDWFDKDYEEGDDNEINDCDEFPLPDFWDKEIEE